MNQQLFRKKSVDKVSSPEQLNEYIRVANPGVWMVLAAIVILLAGGGCGYASDGRRIVDMGGRCHTSFECKNG